MSDIIKTSASAIESFDDSSPFGCKRRWYFEKVLKLQVPPRDNLTLGTNLHTAIELFLVKGSIPESTEPDVRRLFSAIKPEVIRVREEGFLALEHPIDFMLAPDVRIIGRIDVLRKNGPLDWKTSSNVGQYAPTPYKLARSTQMLTYAAWQDGVTFEGNDIGSPEQVTHVYVQTKGAPVTQRIDALMSPKVLTEGVSRVINIAREMKEAAKLPNANDLKPDRTKCRANTKMPCPFLAVCPVENSTMSSALDRLKARLNTSTPLPPAVKEVVKAVQAIVPADAPAPAPVEKFMAVPPPKARAGQIIDMTEPTPEMVKQVDAALAKAAAAKEKVKPPFGMTDAERAAARAKVVRPDPSDPDTTGSELTQEQRDIVEDQKAAEQGVTATANPTRASGVAPSAAAGGSGAASEAPRRGPGRPPGAKNKKAADTLPEGSTGTGGLEQAVAGLPKVTFKTVTVSMTGKLNMGHFQSLDVHVSQTADYTGGADDAFRLVTATVKKQLDAALENVAGRKVEDEVPPQVLMSTKR